MIARISALALIALISSLLLRELGWKAVPTVGVAVTLGALGVILPHLSSVGGELGALAEEVGASGIVLDILKVVGVGYLGGTVSEVCRGMGESTLSSAVTLVARAEMLVIAAPYFFKIVSLGLELLK